MHASWDFSPMILHLAFLSLLLWYLSCRFLSLFLRIFISCPSILFFSLAFFIIIFIIVMIPAAPQSHFDSCPLSFLFFRVKRFYPASLLISSFHFFSPLFLHFFVGLLFVVVTCEKTIHDTSFPQNDGSDALSLSLLSSLSSRFLRISFLTFYSLFDTQMHLESELKPVASSSSTQSIVCKKKIKGYLCVLRGNESLLKVRVRKKEKIIEKSKKWSIRHSWFFDHKKNKK